MRFSSGANSRITLKALLTPSSTGGAEHCGGGVAVAGRHPHVARELSCQHRSYSRYVWRSPSVAIVGHEVRHQCVRGAPNETGTLAADEPHIVPERRGAAHTYVRRPL